MSRQAAMKQKSKARRSVILTAAITLARRPGGWSSLTRAGVAAHACCSNGIVSFHFGSMDGLRRAVMRAAIKHEHLDLIGQGIASGDKLALRVPATMKARAVNCFFGE